MVNIGKFATNVVKDAPAPHTAEELDRTIRLVVGCFNNRWMRFDTLEIAKQVMPINQHHLIFVDPNDLQSKYGVKKTIALGRRFAAATLLELWAKILLNSFDPQAKYDDIVAMESQRRSAKSGKVKRYKRKLAYTFHFNSKEQNHINAYVRLTPQAAALVDLIDEWVTTRSAPYFTEAELEGLLNLRAGELHTRQDPWRIFQYYRGRLITSGFLRYAKEVR